MMKRISHILLFLAAASASAQNLSTEITVDRTIVPAERAATRLGSVHPSILTARVAPTRIGLTEYDAPGTVTRSARTLVPAAWADTFALSPYRGYASLGYFPTYNLGLSAGYRIIQSRDTRLGVWTQFDGSSYSRRIIREATEKTTFRNNTVAVGADFDHRFRNHGTLTAAASYNYGRIVAPVSNCAGNHGIGMADVRLAWYGHAERLGYHVDAELHTFGYNENDKDDPLLDGGSDTGGDHAALKGTELEIAFGTGLMTRLGGEESAQHIGLELKADFLKRPEASVQAIGFYTGGTGGAYYGMITSPASTLGVVSITPYYTFGRATGLNMRLGARIDLGTGGEGKKFHIAPAVRVGYTATGFAIYARAGGGEVLNTGRSLYDYSPYMPIGWQYERSHLPITVDAGINIGPFAGFGAELFGGWARANDWLMPSLMNICGPVRGVFRATDIKGFHAGARLTYAFRSIADATVSAEFAPQKEHSGYYMWRDRAKMVLKAEVAVRPIARLELKASYELRDGRACYLYNRPDEEPLKYSLGDASLLSFGARYAVTPAIDVFARGENLLASRYLVLPEVVAQGVHGLIGASVKF